MQYALLAHGRTAAAQDTPAPITDALAEILARPGVTGWARLHADSAATTVRNGAGQPLLTDGPFIDSKEYLAGLILIEAENLDEALDVAREIQETRSCGAIEVRPVIEWRFRAA